MCIIHYSHYTPCNHTSFNGYLPCALFYSVSSPRCGLFCTRLPVPVSTESPLPTPPHNPSSSTHTSVNYPLSSLDPSLPPSSNTVFSLDVPLPPSDSFGSIDLSSPPSDPLYSIDPLNLPSRLQVQPDFPMSLLNTPIREELSTPTPNVPITTPLPAELLTVQVETVDTICNRCEASRSLHNGMTRIEAEGRRERWLAVWERGIEDGLWWGRGGYAAEQANRDERNEQLAGGSAQNPLVIPDMDTRMQDRGATTRLLPLAVNRHTVVTVPAPAPTAAPGGVTSSPAGHHPPTTTSLPLLPTPFEAAINARPPIGPLYIPSHRRRSSANITNEEQRDSGGREPR